jgi:hypothetical protein
MEWKTKLNNSGKGLGLIFGGGRLQSIGNKKRSSNIKI